MIVNGKNIDLPQQITINELIEKLNLSVDTIVVEVDGKIIDKDKYSKKLNNNNKVEIISFVGGG
ncbi:sulfur carrier protein [Keratinibaculum paraultunense]|uniref:Sulfur carrier protein n=1 Tax=Keratinibaculum paraultunense TaxID=1278232 RepID=A0A4R3KXV4_9FIRM|nr:sulfur carrier protein ThiS [Keratinibaculum paraultunense]QQY80239.1 sulfur carrier protein ThiS [Keratinibaculum paraultunense]TCS90752.1 sulfur carrier protein [Keratinibaculum paraultunense]